MDARLLLVDIEASAREPAGREGGDERALVDHRTARRVDEDGVRLDQRELARADEVPRRWSERAAKRDEIRTPEQIVEGGEGRPDLALVHLGEPRSLGVEHRHVEAAGAPRDRPADAPEADDPDGLAVHARAGEVHRLRTGEGALAQRRIRLDHAPRRGEQEREVQIGGRLRDDGRNRRHCDLARGRRGEVDRRGNDGHAGDEAQARGLGEGAGVDRVVHEVHEHVRAPEALDQLQSGQDAARVPAHLDVGERAQPRESGLGDRLRDEDARLFAHVTTPAAFSPPCRPG